MMTDVPLAADGLVVDGLVVDGLAGKNSKMGCTIL